MIQIIFSLLTHIFHMKCWPCKCLKNPSVLALQLWQICKALFVNIDLITFHFDPTAVPNSSLDPVLVCLYQRMQTPIHLSCVFITFM